MISFGRPVLPPLARARSCGGVTSGSGVSPTSSGGEESAGRVGRSAGLARRQADTERRLRLHEDRLALGRRQVWREGIGQRAALPGGDAVDDEVEAVGQGDADQVAAPHAAALVYARQAVDCGARGRRGSASSSSQTTAMQAGASRTRSLSTRP